MKMIGRSTVNSESNSLRPSASRREATSSPEGQIPEGLAIGNPDGFAAHRKLKAHADEYVAKPVDTELLVERVGALIGAVAPRTRVSGCPPGDGL